MVPSILSCIFATLISVLASLKCAEIYLDIGGGPSVSFFIAKRTKLDKRMAAREVV